MASVAIPSRPTPGPLGLARLAGDRLEPQFWDGWIQLTGTTPTEGRYRVSQSRLHLKVRRSETPQWMADQFCELLCSNLGMALGVSILPMRLAATPSVGSCLVSPELEVALVVQARTSAETAPILDRRRLAVFEEWAMNTDDKPEHVRYVRTPGPTRLVVLDHGHTLHAWRNPTPTVEGIATDPTFSHPASSYKCYGPYHAPELEAELHWLHDEGPAAIEIAITATRSEFLAADGSCADIQEILPHIDHHIALARAILVRRLEDLGSVLLEKYP